MNFFVGTIISDKYAKGIVMIEKEILPINSKAELA